MDSLASKCHHSNESSAIKNILLLSIQEHLFYFIYSQNSTNRLVMIDHHDWNFILCKNCRIGQQHEVRFLVQITTNCRSSTFNCELFDSIGQ